VKTKLSAVELFVLRRGVGEVKAIRIGQDFFLGSVAPSRIVATDDVPAVELLRGS